jgi:hypothetical protein
LNILNNILYDEYGVLNNELTIYLDNINVNLNKSDFLVSNNKIVKMLEKMADYLLHVYKKKDDDKTYKIYKYTELIKKATAERKSIGIIIKDLYFNYASKDKNEIIYIEYKKNCLKVKKQKITKKDFQTIPILKDYEYLKEKIKDELSFLDSQNLKNKKRKTILRAMYGEIVTDQLLVKDSVLGTIYFKNSNNINIKDNDYVPFNFNDRNNILELLRCKEDLTTSIGCIVYDLNNLIKKIKWSSLEKTIIQMYKDEKKVIEISYELGLKYHEVRKYINNIYKKIIKKYNMHYKAWVNKKYI